MTELESQTLHFPVVGPNTSNKDKSLQRSKKIRQANKKVDICWAVEDVSTGQRWEFSEDTSWETFKKTVGFKEGLWIWYEVTGANGETVISVEDEFDTMRRLAILSWADSREYVRIQLGDPKDLEEESGY
jgi:hypothetical protein